MRLMSCVGVAAALAGFSSALAFAADWPKQKILPLDLALEAAQATMALCPRGTISVVDATGTERLFMLGDQAQDRIGIDNARGRALAALGSRMNSSAARKQAESQPGGAVRWLLENPQFRSDGGVPIMVGKEVVGAIGLTAPGAARNPNEVCIAAGIAKIQARLDALR